VCRRGTAANGEYYRPYPFATGAEVALIYFDPQRGERRRALTIFGDSLSSFENPSFNLR
jgi:hypothetical protein